MLPDLLREIEQKRIPPVILVGGDSEYLAEDAFDTVRERILAVQPSTTVEAFAAGADLGQVIDSFRTFSLFGGARLLVVPEMHAFVTRKEIAGLYEKAVADWTSAKTDRKRSSAVSKLLHLLGLLGMDVADSDAQIVEAIGLKKGDRALPDMLEMARATGKHATRGEGDAALLADAVSGGGAPGTTLLMRTGEIPEDAPTVALIRRQGAVIVCDLSRDDFPRALDQAVRSIAAEYDVTFDSGALVRFRQRLGIERALADKFSRDVPDLRSAVAELERLATFVGAKGKVTGTVVDQQIAAVAGGARYELASLFAEKKPLEAVAKLRDLVAQARREDPKTPIDIHVGKFIFPLADEVRQLIGILTFARQRKIDLRRGMQFNDFKATLADPLGEYLKARQLVRQRPHPFALFKRFEAAKLHREPTLLALLAELAELEYARKSGGPSPEVAMETFLLRAGKR